MSNVQQIRDYLATLHLHATRAEATRSVTPKVIGQFYDLYLSSQTVERLCPLEDRESAKPEFMNYGYWDNANQDRHSAQAHLIEILASRFADRSGRVLDVACGTGATTAYLAQYWKPQNICATNISYKQAVFAASHCSSSDFAVMDAASLAFAPESFDNILCVEAAFHFQTRKEFLSHALRILRPHGTIALSDILLYEEGHDLLPMWLRCNYLGGINDYKRLLESVGFSTVDVHDITDAGWRSFARHRWRDLYEEWVSGKYDFAELQKNLAGLYRLLASIKYNLLCFARKQ